MNRPRHIIISTLWLACCLTHASNASQTAAETEEMSKEQQMLDSLNRAVANARNDSAESRSRLDRICFFYNHDMNDSLAVHAESDMKFNRRHGFWDNYYETWEHKANDLIFCGKVNTGLRELKQMHDDALERNHQYGLGLAYYGMGNAYISMEHHDEAKEAYLQALTLLQKDQKTSRTMILDLYSYYCDALNEKHEYEQLLDATRQWKKKLEEIEKEKSGKESKEKARKSQNVWYAYYYLACAQAHIGLSNYDDAKTALDSMQYRSSLTTDDGDFIYMSHLYYRAQLMLATGHLKEALELNTERVKMSEAINDVSSPVMIHRQRAEILRRMGKYQEAADTYLKMYQLKDSLDSRQMREQANELATLYRVDELAQEKELASRQAEAARMRFMAAIAFLVGFFLLAFVIYWYVMSRRLRRKNEELTVAHEKAQESSRMKTKFIQNMSNEIHTPLNILGGFAQILSQSDVELPADTRREACETILENSNRITTLINQLLALSDADSRTIIEEKETIGCNELCLRAITASGIEDAPQRHFTFESKMGDEDTLETAARYATDSLCRLLDNAQKFSPEGSTIRFTCEKQGKMMVMAIENETTQPIPASEAERIFEPFVQLDEFHEGVGVGLSVSRNVMRHLGGDIVLDTDYKEGARFVITLPL